MYRSGCTETVPIMSVQCTEVAHLYVPKWSYRSGPPHVPKWSCTELVLPRLFLPPPWSSGPTFKINLESHVTEYRHKVLGLGLGPHVLLLLLVYTARHTSGVNTAGESAHQAYEQAECWPDDSVMLQLKEHQYCHYYVIIF